MVRSSSSCFKVLTCGRDSLDIDDFNPTESKESTDKRGWSFRKRSARHRVLSNTVISENPSTGNKESPASTTITATPQPNLTVPEKVSVPPQTKEKPELPTAAHSRETDLPIATEVACKIDRNLEESVAIVIQAAIRGYLARRALLKLKTVVKLQAAVRGHLVRRQAVGTLRCVQAIVKMQALVRARRARLLVEGSVNEKDEQTVKPVGKEDLGTKPNQTNSSTKKLLSNGFARQLWESAPKTKPIHIKCDTSESNSAWNWLERWMSVSPSELALSGKPVGPENQEQGKNIKAFAAEAVPATPAEVVSAIADLKSNSSGTAAAAETEKSLITCDADDFDFQAGHLNCSSKRDDLDQPQIEDGNLVKAQNADNLGFQDSHSNCPSIKDDHDQPRVEDGGLRKLQEASSKIDSFPNQTEESSVISQMVLNSVSEKPELNSEEPKCTTVASEQLEIGSKKFVFGSRKVSNPAFIAVKSKFEELSSSETCRSIGLINPDFGTESKLDNLPCPEDSVTQTKESSLTENSISYDPKVQVGSEYGTKLSFSSTLDSPDISEVGGGELEHEAKIAEKWADDVNSVAGNVHKLQAPDPEAKNFSTKIPLYLSHDASGHPGEAEDVNGESIDPVVAVDSPGVEQQPDKSVSDVQVQRDSIIDQQVCKSSPEGSPRSHMTVPESHGTPSSQVSIKSKKDKLDSSGSNQNRKSKTKSKRSTSNQNDSGVSSTEQLYKDSKNGKRHISFGSARSDPIDQERRDSSSSNSLPSYMQATESAKAKAQHAQNSPRSSPDVQDKDVYIKKRHSLPNLDGKQGSPRMQRTTSQQVVKGNGTHSPHERKWQKY
ncbi:protein IQ-DOMAIN 32-like [Macadamia integrifolia]|uniref:protein IQ-DOMAIN 32-like n=1 Tax=Macadamia integrifolia TaxID=60698 RepID=UPI001C4E976D|nr:protein IQ-DOMAIN 32-like [Macadamia integrifolia]